MRLDEALDEAERHLTMAGLEQPWRESASLLALALEKPRSFLIAHPEYQLKEGERSIFHEMIARRAGREPLQYIAQRQEFWGLEFEVMPGVLIPRPETEILVEAAIEHLSRESTQRFLEVGVGSGCISVSILHSLPDATAVATDVSVDAIEITGRNAARYGVAERLNLHHADLTTGIEGPFRLLVSNPPYIPDDEINGLQPEVRDHEPREALAGGPDGLGVVRRLIERARHMVDAGGVLMLEIGEGQAAAVAALFDPLEWEPPEFRLDLRAIPRVVVATQGVKPR